MSDKIQGGVKAGSTSVTIPFQLYNAATGLPETGKVAADLTGYYYRQGSAAAVALSFSNLAALNSAYSSGGVKEVTNIPGHYILHAPDAMFAAGADYVDVVIYTSTSSKVPFTFELGLKVSLEAAYVPPTVAAVADAVWDEPISGHQTAGTAGAALVGASPGSGSTSWPITITDDNGIPIADVNVWVTTDVLGANVVASGKTDALGVAQPSFMLDAGDYYCWRQKSGVNFVNPASFTVV